MLDELARPQDLDKPWHGRSLAERAIGLLHDAPKLALVQFVPLEGKCEPVDQPGPIQEGECPAHQPALVWSEMMVPDMGERGETEEQPFPAFLLKGLDRLVLDGVIGE